MSKWIDEKDWDFEKSPHTNNIGEGVVEQMREHKPKELTLKEIQDSLRNTKPTPWYIYMGKESMKAWDKAIKDLIKEQSK